MTDHYFGRQGLAWSFWVNLVFLRVALFVGQELISATLLPGSPWLIMALAFVFHGLLFFWQAVGVLRAADAHVRGSGQMYTVWGTQLTVIIAAFWVFSYTFEAWHFAQSHHVAEALSDHTLNSAQAAKYAVALSADETTIVIEGPLELGVTKRMSALLNTSSKVSEVALTSPGGNIYEARGLAAVIRAHGLTTLVASECSSACVTAFIGGSSRKLVQGARLGLHQYRIDATYPIFVTNPEQEQERDLALFKQAGVAPWFLTKIFQSSASEMWFPDPSELLSARVVTEIVPR